MATGDIKWFQQGLLDLGNKLHNLSSDVLMLGIVTTTTVPTMATAVPCWGAAGTTNFSTNQVTTAGGYTGPITLASVTWALQGGLPTLRATDIVIPAHASGFTNGAYGILYNNTDANKRCLGYFELSSTGTTTIASGSLTLNFQGGAGTDVLQITAS